jgi:hypothetical protein
VQVLCLVALIDRAPLDELTNPTCILWPEEGTTQPMKRLLDTLMAHAMGVLQNGRPGAG